MLKFVIALISLLVVMSEGQRPPYAGSANRYPQVLPRFQDEEDAANAAAATTGNNANVGNRVGEESTGSGAESSFDDLGMQVPVRPAAPGAFVPAQNPTTSTSELPVLALGQADFVDRVKTWPEDQRPFWYTNREHIAAHLNPANQQTVLRPNVETRSFFAGK